MMGAGDYWQGENYLNAHPQHEVCLTDGFWLDEFDVTNAAYQQFIDAGGDAQTAHSTPATWLWLHADPHPGPRDYPRFLAAPQPRHRAAVFQALPYVRRVAVELP